MRTLIITGGTLSRDDLVSKEEKFDLVICADSGANYAFKHMIVPDILVGDMDSIEPIVYEFMQNIQVERVVYPAEKDFTDTHIAIKYAIDRGTSDITILGGIGNRIDHTLANLSLMVNLIKNNIGCRIINDHCKVYLSTGSIEIRGSIGDTVSLLPLTELVSNVTIKGFKYKLCNIDLTMGNPIGVSNVLTSSKGIVTHENGILAIIFARD